VRQIVVAASSTFLSVDFSEAGESISEAGFRGSQADVENCCNVLDGQILAVVKQKNGTACR
jgi:hypothetical protein